MHIRMHTYAYWARGRGSDASNGALNLHPKEEHSRYTLTLIVVTTMLIIIHKYI